jgi:hypothetical protein
LLPDAERRSSLSRTKLVRPIHPPFPLLFTALFAAALATAQQSSAQATPAKLEVQVQKPIAKVSPTLFGLMTEEINFSYDGGLYGELVQNRALLDDGSPPFARAQFHVQDVIALEPAVPRFAFQ